VELDYARRVSRSSVCCTHVYTQKLPTGNKLAQEEVGGNFGCKPEMNLPEASTQGARWRRVAAIGSMEGL